MAQNITLLGASYSDVPAVNLPKTGGGTARFDDTTDADATAADIISGKTAYVNGVKLTGTGTGGGGTPTLETVTKTYTPSTSAVTDTITPSSGYDGIEEVDVTVSAVPMASFYSETVPLDYSTENNNRVWKIKARTELDPGEGDTEGWISAGYYDGGTRTYNAIAKNTTITPTTSSQTIGGANYMMEGAVTVSAMPSGTAGTPTATKGAVNNHAISVTPSVTNTTGYITGGTKTGTAVSVSASDVCSGSETKTANGTYDVTNLAQLVVNVSGGGSSNFTLLGTKSVGTISTSSTTDTDTGQTIVVTGWNDYDLIVCECSVNTQTNNRHLCSTRLAWLTASSAVTTKNGCTFATATWNAKKSSSGTVTTRSNTTPYGVYAKAGTISGSNLTITIYQRYNSTQTGTINGSYTMRVYGCKIYDLIGG